MSEILLRNSAILFYSKIAEEICRIQRDHIWQIKKTETEGLQNSFKTKFYSALQVTVVSISL